MNKLAGLLAITGIFAALGCANSVLDEAPLAGGIDEQSSVIVGSVGWRDVQELNGDSPERINSHTVAYLSIPAKGTRCTGFLVSDNVIMTNEHCVGRQSDANGLVAIFGREAGNAQSAWDVYDCSTLIGNSASLDYALLQCTGNPGATYGVAQLDDGNASRNEDLYVIHQNCDYFSRPGCEPSKKYSPGRVTRVDSEVRHDADTLGGSSGSPVFRTSNHAVFALHHVGLGNRGDGRGTGNYAVKMSDIMNDISSRFSDLQLGSGGVVEPPPALDADAFEPNDDANNATQANLPFSAQMSLHSATDTDVVRIDLDADATLNVTASFLNADGDLDLALYAAGAEDPSGSATTTSDVENFSAELGAGTYYLVIYGYEGATNTYALDLATSGGEPVQQTPTEGDIFEPNNSATDAADIGAVFSWDGIEIADGDDEDFFRVSLTETTTVDVLFSDDVGDLDLYVFDDDGNEVARSISASDNETVALGAGTYVLQIVRYRGAMGDYDLRVGR